MGLLYLRNVTTLKLDEEKCTGCGTCAIVCPHSVLAVEGRRARIATRDACMECGACATNCPAEAATVEAGVGCAAAVINESLGRTDASCCCAPSRAVKPDEACLDELDSGAAEDAAPPAAPGKAGTGCCC
ncbi:mercury methylation ferredoxin HgcB [Planctomycetota bacterium]